MPAKSKAQARLMFAAAEGKVKGISPKVGREFVKATPKVAALPERVTRKPRARVASPHPGEGNLPRMHDSRHN